jgi:hypothetical protein
MIVKLLRSTTPGAVPSALQSGQIAINEADAVLFWRGGEGAVKSLNLLALTSATPVAADNSAKVATTAFVAAAITALINGAPAALSTLKAFAGAINNDAAFASTMSTALGARLRFDAAQALTTGQQAQAQANLGIGAAGLLAIATAAQFLANTANLALATDKVWSAAAWGAKFNVSGTFTPDLATFLFTTISVTGNITIANPVNTKDGQAGAFLIIQDATGGRTVSWGSAWKPLTQAIPTINTAASGSTYISFHVQGGQVIFSGGKI